MASITETLHVPVPPARAFDHLADFTTTEAWDPSIVRAERLDDGPLQVGSRFRVGLKVGLVTVPLVYEITRYVRPHHLVLTTRGLTHRGEDDISINATEEGAEVVWNARFSLRGPGRLLDPVLGVGFRRTATAAVAGLQRSLEALALR